ncbi:MAG: AAA family ATPase [Sphingopyxis sp.]|nr:AAA family ATPase [Sphingopyxis sp.]
MKLRALEVANFRKFRKPLEITGIAEGLNIVVEPNEAGKSTLLEALRAALFIRHSAKSELVRSFCPFGDEVGPRVGLDFEVDGEAWRLDKQFLKAASITLVGPSGRFESDAAEDRLQTLLGFDKGNNRGTDPESRGALGLLWVEQASALAVEPPGHLVRNNIRSALEAEVGAVLGGRRFELVRARIDEAYAALRTARTGKPTGRLAEAESRAAEAGARREVAEDQLRSYEQSLAALEQARTQKRLIERELEDPEMAEQRRKLAEDLKLAESAQLRLTAAQARHAEGEAQLKALDQALAAFEHAESAVHEALAVRDKANAALAAHRQDHEMAVEAETTRRTALAERRQARRDAQGALDAARTIAEGNARRQAVARARAQLSQVKAAEQAIAVKRDLANSSLTAKDVEQLAALDRKVTETQTLRDAGAVSIEVELTEGQTFTIDGEPATAGRHDVLQATTFAIGKAARLTITPPAVVGRSAVDAHDAALEAYHDKLAELEVESYAAAVKRLNAAQNARDELVVLERQLAALCPGDITLDLAPGAAALKLFLEDQTADADDAEAEPDLAALSKALDLANEAEQHAIGQHESAQQTHHQAETRLVQLGADTATAERDVASAQAQLTALEGEHDRSALAAQRQAAGEDYARRVDALDQAERAAGALDIERIRRSIAHQDQAQTRAQEERLALVAKIASLEATVASEGPKGLAGIAAETREVEESAAAQLVRLTREADVLALLRDTLREAGDAAARTFLGPVTRRAARYVERILPGSDLVFAEDMGLVGVRRDGFDEGCGDLSRGTQEQLAVLTRLAFADLLLDRKAPVSLILDDPLVYSDDARLEVMTDLLEEAGTRMQVILLTCRSKAFRHVAAHRIDLAGASA